MKKFIFIIWVPKIYHWSAELPLLAIYLLPEFYNKFGILNVIEFSDELITYIIENYTNEPGVRKLKEILFELISSINLDLLKKTQKYNIPVIITKEIVENIL